MDKIITVVKIGGREFKLSGYEDEEYMHRVAIAVDRKFTEVKLGTLGLDDTAIAILAAINIADEALKLQDEHTELQQTAAKLTEENMSLKKQLEPKEPAEQKKAAPAPPTRESVYRRMQNKEK